MIILTKTQRDLFLTTKEGVINDLLANGADYIPIEAKNNKWILPDEILLDGRFGKVKTELDKIGEFDKYEKRTFALSELKDPIPLGKIK